MNKTKIIQERNRYYTGKFMTADDFADEQAYFLNRHWLHNRLLHGWGILVGLHVVEHPDELCRQDHVVVTAGIAIDCYGREIILKEDTVYPFPKGKEEGILCLSYREEKIAHGPVLFSEGCEESTRNEFNRLLESFALELKHPKEVGKNCWPGEMPEKPANKVKNDCDDAVPFTGHATLAPACDCLGGVVPLAKLTLAEDSTHRLPKKVVIDATGRHKLMAPGHQLTHIIGVNWHHGEGMTIDWMRAQNGRLTVQFDRQLLISESAAYGINEFTFTVQYWGAQRSPEFMPGTVSLEENNSLAVFTIEDAFLSGLEAMHLNKVLITLRCDFIRDCHGESVDGNHLCGQLPSGNGTPGGLFESWFQFVPSSSLFPAEGRRSNSHG